MVPRPSDGPGENFPINVEQWNAPGSIGKMLDRSVVEQSSKVQQGMEKRMLDRSLAEQSSKVWKNWLLTI